MANWKHTLKISKEWRATENDEMELPELARIIATRLKALPPYGQDDTLGELVLLFEEFVEYKDESTEEDFDDIMEKLYDWGDTELDNDWPRTRLCWIDAMSAA